MPKAARLHQSFPSSKLPLDITAQPLCRAVTPAPRGAGAVTVTATVGALGHREKGSWFPTCRAAAGKGRWLHRGALGFLLTFTRDELDPNHHTEGTQQPQSRQAKPHVSPPYANASPGTDDVPDHDPAERTRLCPTAPAPRSLFPLRPGRRRVPCSP